MLGFFSSFNKMAKEIVHQVPKVDVKKNFKDLQDYGTFSHEKIFQ